MSDQVGTTAPDAQFSGANFEVKELYPPDRRRHDDYKDELRKAGEKFFPDEMFTPYSPIDMVLSDVVEQVTELAARFSSHYDAATRSTLDLLVYANLLHVERIIPTPIQNLGILESLGWRSVSFVKGTSTSCVLTAANQAPEILRNQKGVLVQYGQRVLLG